MIAMSKASIPSTLDEGKVIPFTPRSESPTRARRRANVLTLRRRGLVPLAIADVLGLGDGAVRRYLRELIAEGELSPLSPWYSITAERATRGAAVCPTCGQRRR
jgi:hypothetical protein